MRQITLFDKNEQTLEKQNEFIEKKVVENEVKTACEVCGRNADIRCDGHIFCMSHYEIYYFENIGCGDFEFI